MKIIRFFLPRIFKLIPLYFIIAVGVTSLLTYFNLMSDVIVMLIIYLGFPMAATVTSSITVSGNIHWILLTPHKKSHLILINAAINFIKTSLIIVLLGLYTSIKFPGEIPKFIGSLFEETPFIEIVYPSGFYFAAILISMVVLVFHFCILTLDQNRLQDSRLHRTSDKRMQVLKILGISFTGLFILGAGWKMLEEFFVFIPFNITAPLALGFFVTISIVGTLETLKSYYSKKKVIASGLIFSSLISAILFSISFHNLNLGPGNISTRISDLNNTGIYGEDYRDKISSELMTSNNSSINLKEADVGVLSEIAPVELNRAFINWNQACAGKKDYNCRLAYYAELQLNKKASPSRLKLSCALDVESCFLGYRRSKAPEEQVFFRDHILQYCDKPHNSAMSRCKDFISKTI